MHGYCGRAVVAGRAEVAAAEVAGGARADSVRPVTLLAGRRHLAVRIGPRATAAQRQDGETSDARARAA